MEKLPTTPSQTIGPFFAYSLTAEQYKYNFNSIVNEKLLNDKTAGEQICIKGKVFDGAGNTVHDAMIELWQADAAGEYRTAVINKKNDGFTGFGRVGTGVADDHSFCLYTIKPAAINNEAPHINISLFMRGSLHRLSTRLYFSDEVNDNDPLLSSIDPERRKTLIAKKEITSSGIEYVFNIFMQGENETVFFQL
jgi:protocatechuate 3,4-dioxygenase, alpha subunit